MMTVIDVATSAALQDRGGDISGKPVATDHNVSKSPHLISPPALVSRKCKRSVYRKNILKYHRMRCLISLIASSKSEGRHFI